MTTKKQSVQQTFEKPIKALVENMPFGTFVTHTQMQKYAQQWSRYIQRKLIQTLKTHISVSSMAHSVFVDLYDLKFVPKTKPSTRSKLLADFLPPVITGEVDKFDLMIQADVNGKTKTSLNAMQKSLRLMPLTERKKFLKQIKQWRGHNSNEIAYLLHEKLTGAHVQMPSDVDGKMDFLLKYPYALHIESDNREVKLNDRLDNASKILCYLLEDDYRQFCTVVSRPDSREDIKNRAMRAHRILMNDGTDKEYDAEDLINKVLIRPNEVTDLNDKQIDLILGDVQPMKVDNQQKKTLKRVCYRLREGKENS